MPKKRAAGPLRREADCSPANCKSVVLEPDEQPGLENAIGQLQCGRCVTGAAACVGAIHLHVQLLFG
jgi:hypothetical protein